MESNTKYFIADLVEEVGSLNAVAAQVVAMTSDPDCDLNQITRVILSDNVMSLRFLALANSAAVSRGTEVRNLRDCLVRLGLDRVRNVALLMGMHDMTPGGGAAAGVDMGEFWNYNLATASCAQNLAALRGGIEPDDAWLVGILHGIGVIALSQKAPEDFQNSLLRARALKTSLADAEMTTLEFHHGEIGGRILSQWHLPRVFADSVEFHPELFEKQEVSEEAWSMIRLLRQAIQLARALAFGDSGDGTAPLPLPRIAEELGLSGSDIDELAHRVEMEVAEISALIGMDLPSRPDRSTRESSQKLAARLALEGLEDSLARDDLEEQLGMAREIQRRLLPERTPELPGYAMAAANHPCQHISGDYYDFIKIKNAATGIVIADVSGKGMPASLLASNLQASLRALAQIFLDPGELLANVNRALFNSTDPEHFATLFLAVMEPDGTGFRYASAGHNPPLLLKADGSAHWLKPAGTPLGMFEEMAYPVSNVRMDPGDLLVAYTDGVTEATDPQETEFTEDGLERSVRARHSADCAAILQGVIRDVDHHVHGEGTAGDAGRGAPGSSSAPASRISDDLTLIVLRRET